MDFDNDRPRISPETGSPLLTELALSDSDCQSAFLFSHFDDDAPNLLHLKLLVDGDVFAGSFDLSTESSFVGDDDVGDDDVGDDDVNDDAIRDSRETVKALRGKPESQYLIKLERNSEADRTKSDVTLTWSCEVEGTCLQIGAAFLRRRRGVESSITSGAVLRHSESGASELSAVLRHAASSIDALGEENARLKKENVKLRSDRKKLLEKYEKIVDEQSDVEDKLMKTFVLVLNEKKTEIKRLRARVEGGGGGEDDDDEEEEEPRREGMDNQNVKSDEDYEGDTDVDSDNDQKDDPSDDLDDNLEHGRKRDIPSISRVHESMPSSSKSKADDSIPTKKSKVDASPADAGGDAEAKSTKPISFVRNFLDSSSDDD